MREPSFECGWPTAGGVALSARAEEVAASVALDATRRFESARRVVREALAEDGVASEIDAAVGRLLKAG